ncbi:hypothetical protein C8R43DRAFT_965664 [Mycena crocata]|nr:hypothetical protein C8R43DRAFT_965664 [Mycena crocata]
MDKSGDHGNGLQLALISLDKASVHDKDEDEANKLLSAVGDHDNVGFNGEFCRRKIPSEETIAISESPRKASVAKLDYQREHDEGKAFWETVRLDVMSLVDIGLMAKLANPEKYVNGPYTELSLQGCVRNCLGMHLDKSNQDKEDWDTKIDFKDLQYAAKDARAALDVYKVLKVKVAAKSVELDRRVPAAWYTYHYIRGEEVNIHKTVNDTYLHWTSKVCPWFGNGRFHGYLE